MRSTMLVLLSLVLLPQAEAAEEQNVLKAIRAELNKAQKVRPSAHDGFGKEIAVPTHALEAMALAKQAIKKGGPSGIRAKVLHRQAKIAQAKLLLDTARMLLHEGHVPGLAHVNAVRTDQKPQRSMPLHKVILGLANDLTLAARSLPKGRTQNAALRRALISERNTLRRDVRTFERQRLMEGGRYFGKLHRKLRAWKMRRARQLTPKR